MKFKELIPILKRIYKEYIVKHLNKIFLSLFLSILVAGSTSSIAWLLDPAVKKIFIEQDKTLAWAIPIAIVLVFATKGISLYFARLLTIRVAQEICGEIQKKVSGNILFSDIKTLDSRHSGKYISNIMFDSHQIQQLVGVGVLNLMKDSFTALALIFVMFYQNWKLALFAVLMIPLAGGFAKSLGKRVGKVVSQAGELSGKLATLLSEIFRASKMIRIYQKEKEESSKADKLIDDLIEKNIKHNSVMIRAAPIMETLTGIMIAGFIFFSGKLISSGELGVNNFFSFLAAMMLAYQPIRSLATINMVAYQGCAAFKRISSIIDKKIEIKQNSNLPNLEIKKCNINFSNVNFKYETTNDKALRDLTLEIKGGTMSALVGHSGAGISTIIY